MCTTKKLYDYDFVKSANDNLSDCFELCSLHVTEYSSVIFDSIYAGIPSILTAFSSDIIYL